MGIIGKKKEIGPDTFLQRNNEILFNEVDGEVVILSIENGEYYGLDKVGSRIWELLIKPIKASTLIRNLIKEYDVNVLQCTNDTYSFLDSLYQKNLILLE